MSIAKNKPTAPAAAPTQPTQPSTVPTVHSYSPFILSQCADAAEFRESCANAVDAMATPPRGLDKEERAAWRNAARKAHRYLLSVFPLIEAMADASRHTITVSVVVRDASGEKTADRRPVRIDDAVFARLNLYGRTVTTIGLA